MAIIGLGLAALTGLALGLLGGGGSILTVPILVYVVGFDTKQAVAMSLAIVGIASLVGVARHWRAGRVRVRTGVTLGLVAMVGAFGGARLAAFVSGGVQLVLLAIVMLAAAVLMYRKAGGAPAGGEPAQRGFALTAAAGLGVGLLTGLVGVGGGFMIVPVLVLLLGVPMKEAVGTSLLVITLNAAAGFAGYLGQVAVAWGYLAAFTGVAVAGILAGTRLVDHVPAAALRRGFAVFLVVLGGYMLYQNRSVFAGPSARAELPSHG